MTKKQIRTRWLIAAAAVLLLLFMLGMIRFVRAKYAQDTSVEGRVIFTASLAEDVILRESTAQRQTDGSYQLTEPYVLENTYVLMSGVDIPKDPHILIQGKTNIPAYLFVEIEDTVGNDALTWAVDETLWEAVPGTQNVYVYKTVLDSTPQSPIYILKDNRLDISQHLNCDGRTIEGVLTFRVKLIQKYENADPAQAYKGYTN